MCVYYRGRSSMGNARSATPPMSSSTGNVRSVTPTMSPRAGNVRSTTSPMSSRASSPVSLLSLVPSNHQGVSSNINELIDVIIYPDDISTSIDDSSSIADSVACEGSKDSQKIKSKNSSVKRKKVVPDSDNFAKKKQKNDDAVSGFLEQSTSALSNLAKAVQNSMSESATLKIDEQKHKNPFADTIFVAFDQVPVAQQMDCLIAILNIIKTYQNA